MATRLAEVQSPAAGLILIDTYRFTGQDPDWLLSLPAAPALRAGPRFDQVVSDTAMAATGAYLRIATGWQPSPAGAPTLFLRASEPAPLIPAAGQQTQWHAHWPLAHHTADIAGNHLELLKDHAATTAAAIRSRLSSSRPTAPPAY